MESIGGSLYICIMRTVVHGWVVLQWCVARDTDGCWLMSSLAWYRPALTTCLFSFTLTFSAMFFVMFHILLFSFFFLFVLLFIYFLEGEGRGRYLFICFSLYIFVFFLGGGGRYTHTQWTDDLESSMICYMGICPQAVSLESEPHCNEQRK